VFVLIVALIHQQHRWYVAQQRGAMKERVGVEQVVAFYPKAHALSDWIPSHGGQNVVDVDGKALGYVVQTSPEADDVIGFSGPTNTLIAFDADDRVLGLSILRSGDTREHVAVVLADEAFMTRLNGRAWSEVSAADRVDAVSGATLTSLAIADGIAVRLGGARPSSLFPDEIALSEVRPFLPDAASLRPSERRPDLLEVRDAAGGKLGYVARTSPHADGLIGYQGPTDTLIVLDPNERVTGLALRHSYDNEPYVRYVREDEYFFNIFKGFLLDEVAQLDMVDAGIEGVSGATKTSTTVAEALILAAGELIKVRQKAVSGPTWNLAASDIGTLVVIGLALTIAFTRLRGRRRVRIAFQVVLVVYLGFLNADMVSQALLVGWAQNGVAWRIAPALVMLTAAALLAPVLTRRQVYCSHLCPHGALQEWLRGRVPYQIGVSRRVRRLLDCIPALLLCWVAFVAMLHLPYSLVGIEPFDAYVVRIAGWATIAVALVGLVASLFLPMAYCRYGCPTGAMLEYLRLGGASERLGRRDVLATALALAAVALHVWA